MQPEENNQMEYIDKFEDFKKHGLGLNKADFEKHREQIEKGADQVEALKQYRDYLRQLFQTLETTRNKNYLLFFDWLPEKMRHEAIELVKAEFERWRWEFEHIFLGNRKQLIVFKNYRPLERYLQRYRTPTSYEQLKKQLQGDLQRLEELVQKRNVMWSRDEGLGEVNEELHLQQERADRVRQDFMKMLQQIMEDFISQRGRLLLNLRHLRVELRVDVFNLIEKMGLCSDTLKEHSRGIWETDIYKESKESYERMQNGYLEYEEPRPEEPSEKKEGRESSAGPKQDVRKADSDDDEQPSQPNGVKDYIVDAIGHGRVDVRFRIPFNNLKPITQFVAYTIEKDDINYLCHVTNDSKPDDLFFSMTLKGQGLMNYIIRAENEVGLSQQYEIFTVNIPDVANRKLYLAGDTGQGLIPYLDEENSPAAVAESCVEAIPCCRVSINNAVMAIDTSGNLAMWGTLYEMTDVENDKIEPNVQVCPPYLISELKLVTRISCGQNYYLACDAEGKAYGFGLNNSYQLGLGMGRQKTNTRNPVPISYFSCNKVFIVDVAASIDHSLALDSKGIAYTWGANQVARSHREIKDSFGSIINFTLNQNEVYCQMEPRPISNTFMNVNRIEKIRSGGRFCSLVGDKGELYSWGLNNKGQLGCGQLKNNHDVVRLILVPIENQYFKSHGLRVVQLSLGSSHSLALVADANDRRTLYAWGSSSDNECGPNTSAAIHQPTLVDFFEKHQILHFRAGNSVSMVKSNQGLFLFGSKDFLKESPSTKVDYLRRLQFSWVNDLLDFELAGETAIFLTNA